MKCLICGAEVSDNNGGLCRECATMIDITHSRGLIPLYEKLALTGGIEPRDQSPWSLGITGEGSRIVYARAVTHALYFSTNIEYYVNYPIRTEDLFSADIEPSSLALRALGITRRKDGECAYCGAPLSRDEQYGEGLCDRCRRSANILNIPNGVFTGEIQVGEALLAKIAWDMREIVRMERDPSTIHSTILSQSDYSELENYPYIPSALSNRDADILGGDIRVLVTGNCPHPIRVEDEASRDGGAEGIGFTTSTQSPPIKKARFVYHSQKGREDKSGGSRYKIGFEIEKEDDVVFNHTAHDVLKQTGWVIEKDGSLNDGNGFEAVSPIFPLDLKILSKEFEGIRWVIEAKGSSNCGGHIHISDTETSPRELLMQLKGYYPLLYSMYPSRVNNSYCQAKKIQGYGPNTHYQAFAYGDAHPTLEIRLFPAPRSINTLLFRAELIRYMLDNRTDDPAVVVKDIMEKKVLYKVLLRVYDEDVILNKLILTIANSRIYDNAIDPSVTSIKTFREFILEQK